MQLDRTKKTSLKNEFIFLWAIFNYVWYKLLYFDTFEKIYYNTSLILVLSYLNVYHHPGMEVFENKLDSLKDFWLASKLVLLIKICTCSSLENASSFALNCITLHSKMNKNCNDAWGKCKKLFDDFIHWEKTMHQLVRNMMRLLNLISYSIICRTYIKTQWVCFVT